MNKPRYNPDQHHRRSIRKPGYNYASSGAYMVTICVRRPRRPLLEYPELRAILDEEWQTLPHHFKGITLDEFVIMPDHIHFILWIDADLAEGKRLGDIVGAYKSLTTVAWLKYMEANDLNEQGKFWQDDYFDRIIRDEQELIRCRAYINNNPLKLDHEQIYNAWLEWGQLWQGLS